MTSGSSSMRSETNGSRRSPGPSAGTTFSPTGGSPQLGGRDEHRRELRRILSAWTSERSAAAAAESLQSAGVPAGAMLRLDDIEVDEHLRQRGVFGELVQPQFDAPLPANLGEARFDELAPPRLRPAPLAAQDTRAALRDVLGMTEGDIQRLLDGGVLEEHPEAAGAAVGEAGRATTTRRAS
ncbi:CoA transferase [Cnuibacter sp. UC19_7]|uniref:CoA transferase n=1 Tax=Cnuibacter sp. UC19_7 TaxID=3350166 RepID=UPI00366E6C02